MNIPRHRSISGAALSVSVRPTTIWPSMLNRGMALLIACSLCLATAAVNAQVAPIQKEHDVAFQGMTSDRFTWIDSSGNPRVAVLAHNDQNGPGGTRGGELRELSYRLPGGGTRDVIASSSSAAGFGYIVSHADDTEHCTGLGDR